MGNLATVVNFGVALMPLMPYLADYARAQQQNASRECVESEGGCLRCRGRYCARCAILLHRGTCVDACPIGHAADWSTRDEYMGRICRETGYAFGMTGGQVAILVGVVSGATVCILIVLCGAVVVRRRRREAAESIRCFEDRAERREFLKHLGSLRSEGHTFLAMLNDARRQVRELCRSGDADEGMAIGIRAYRPVLRDLARILLLVNRKDEDIHAPPEDWRRLFAWAERLLGRYERRGSPEVARLVTFLQRATSTNHQTRRDSGARDTISTDRTSSPPVPPTGLATFRANAPLATFQASPTTSSLGRADDDGCPISQTMMMTPTPPPPSSTLVSASRNRSDNRATVALLRSELDPRWEFPDSIDQPNHCATTLDDWTSPGDCCLVDDFTILGLRPQDEITTEL